VQQPQPLGRQINSSKAHARDVVLSTERIAHLCTAGTAALRARSLV
jgi:hypothetical protein